MKTNYWELSFALVIIFFSFFALTFNLNWLVMLLLCATGIFILWLPRQEKTDRNTAIKNYLLTVFPPLFIFVFSILGHERFLGDDYTILGGAFLLFPLAFFVQGFLLAKNRPLLSQGFARSFLGGFIPFWLLYNIESMSSLLFFSYILVGFLGVIIRNAFKR